MSELTSKQIRVTDAPTAVGSDYLRKRHTSQGPGRRNLRAKLPPALRDLSDAELDDRNARVWATVQRACQVAAGVAPDAFPRLCSGSSEGQAYRTAQRAALRICAERYGIPAARLAETAETTPQWVGSVLRQHDPTADALASEWSTRGGPAEIDGVDLVPILVSREAAEALRAFAGDDLGALASAAILAATSERRAGARWTAADDETLRRLDAAGVGAAASARLLGRSIKAVTNRRERLGLVSSRV